MIQNARARGFLSAGLFLSVARESVGAEGEDGSSEAAVADGIWVEFSDRAVPRAQDLFEGGFPIPMAYYSSWVTPNIHLRTLLRFLDGQCGCWATFFMRCCHIAGLNPTDEFITVSDKRPPILNGGARVFFVKEWTFGAANNPDEYWNDEYPYINIPEGDPETTFQEGNSYHWLYEDVSDQTGVDGQRPVANPKSIFSLHYVIRIAGKYYDASYGGEPYTSLSNMDDTAVAAYAVVWWDAGQLPWIHETELGVDLNGDGFIDSWVQTPAFYIQQNPSGTNELKEDPSNPPR